MTILGGGGVSSNIEVVMVSAWEKLDVVGQRKELSTFWWSIASFKGFAHFRTLSYFHGRYVLSVEVVARHVQLDVLWAKALASKRVESVENCFSLDVAY